ncbi:Interferon gamma receptor 1, partial [Galemys pyrenaicus]
PVPTNLKIEAFNFNTQFNWEYPVMSQTPVFTVQVKTYKVNINSTSFLSPQGKIGPPTLAVRKKGDLVITDIFHPLTCMINGKQSEVMYDEQDACYTFEYKVYVRIHENETIDRIQKYSEDDCNETQCRFQIPLRTLHPKYCASATSPVSSDYCVSAEGHSEEWSVTTEMSPEFCIAICGANGNSIEDSIWIPIGAAFLFFLILFVAFGCYRLKKIHSFKNESIMLPKSLMSVVKSSSSEAKPESKYISPITYQPIDTENGKVSLEEQLSSLSTISGHMEDNLGKVEHGELFDITKEVTSETPVSDMAPDSPLTSVRRENSLHSGSNQSELCSVTLNSYHSRNGSDSGLMESDSFLSDSEFPPNNKSEIKTEGQEPVILRNITTSFGYDKPHVLVDLLVDNDGGKESLVGYRLTADSKEFS